MNKLLTLGASLLGVAALVLPASEAAAQGFPSKPIRIVVPFPPGGGADVQVRHLAQKMGENLGQTVLVENKPGAAGGIGTEYVARAKPDGYTLLFTTTGHTVQPHLQNLAWDPVNDFTPLSLITTTSLIIAVNPAVKANTLQELIALAKANPGKLTYGSSGSGGPFHLAVEYFKSMAGVSIVHVPYSGGAPQIVAVLRGEVDMVFDSFTGPLPNILAGKLRAIAVTGPRRAAVLPGTPTVAEAGLPGYQFVSWNGIMAPAATPKDIVARLNAEIVKAVNSPEVSNRYTTLGFTPTSTSLPEFAALVATDLAKNGKIIKDSKMKVD